MLNSLYKFVQALKNCKLKPNANNFYGCVIVSCDLCDKLILPILNN